MTKNILLASDDVSQVVISFLRSKGHKVFSTVPKNVKLDYAISTNGVGTLFRRNLRFGKNLLKKVPVADKLVLWQTKSLIRGKTKELSKLDEVWYLTDPVEVQYGIDETPSTHTKVLPLLLAQLPDIIIGDEDQRLRKVVIIGPERDKHITMTKYACQSLKVDFEIFDPERRTKNWGLGKEQMERELNELLSVCAVSVALYAPDTDQEYYYSDPKRIKQALSFGVPTITTPIPPIWKEIETYSAGYVIKDFYLDSLKLGIDIVLENWQIMSINARTLAEKYLVSSSWIDLD